MKIPTFFIVGAPKCGTTALSEYLRVHPNILISEPKEPYYFCDDFKHRAVDTFEHYMACFKGQSDCHQAVGEASVWYLYSKVAIPKIYQYNREARIIVMLRNPIDMIYSLHSQLLYNHSEDVSEFEEAWALQDKRRHGRNLPHKKRNSEFLQYGDVGMLGRQVDRLLSIFPRDQIKIILFEDFSQFTKQVYEEVLVFLGVESDGRYVFPKINANKGHRLRFLAGFTQRPPCALNHRVQRAKKLFGISKLKILPVLRRLNGYQFSRKTMSHNFRRQLVEFFSDDIDYLSGRLGIELKHWKKMNHF